MLGFLYGKKKEPVQQSPSQTTSSTTKTTNKSSPIGSTQPSQIQGSRPSLTAQNSNGKPPLSYQQKQINPSNSNQISSAITISEQKERSSHPQIFLNSAQHQNNLNSNPFSIAEKAQQQQQQEQNPIGARPSTTKSNQTFGKNMMGTLQGSSNMFSQTRNIMQQRFSTQGLKQDKPIDIDGQKNLANNKDVVFGESVQIKQTVDAHKMKQKRANSPISNSASLLDSTSFNETPCTIQNIPQSLNKIMAGKKQSLPNQKIQLQQNTSTTLSATKSTTQQASLKKGLSTNMGSSQSTNSSAQTSQFQKRLQNQRLGEIGQSSNQAFQLPQINTPQNNNNNYQDNVNKMKKQNQYLLAMAAETGNTQSVADIVNKEKYGDYAPDINCHNKEDQTTTLHIAANEGHLGIAQVVLDNNGEVDPLNSSLRTPLHIACLRGNIEIAKLLIKKGAVINAQDIDGNTCAHFASVFSHKDILQLLLSHNPDITIKNKIGKTALDICGSVRIMKLFEEFIQKQNKQKKSNLEEEAKGEGAVQEENINQQSQEFDLENSLASKMKQLQKVPAGKSQKIKIHTQESHLNIEKPLSISPKKIQKAAGVTTQLGSKIKNDQLIQSSKGGEVYLKTESSQTSGGEYILDSESSNQDCLYQEEKIGPSSFIPIQLLGKGSFGEVYLVTKKSSGLQYAMKVLSKSKIMGQNLVRYAKTERNVLSYTQHPFIVSLKYAFQTQEKLFLILDYCPGGDLAKVLHKERRFTEERARVYSAEILLAIQDLHKRDIIFRDLKPDNVVIDGDGHALLTDFGLSKEGVLDNISAKSFCGSVAYLAPEMLRRSGHGKSVDWYLLGVLLYEMLVGQPPYFCHNKEQLFYNIQKGVLKLPSSISNEAKSLLISLLNRNPNKRLGAGPSDAEEIKKHPFFLEIDWDQVYNRGYNVPRPNIRQIVQQDISPSIFEDTIKDPQNEQEKTSNNNNIPGWSFVTPLEQKEINQQQSNIQSS